MKVAILGYGVEGPSAYRYWRALGADITIRDDRPNLELPAGAQSLLGPDHHRDLNQFDIIVRSPSGKPTDIAAANPGVDLSAKLTSVTREFLARCPAPVIGVTGTKGKGTTSTLISKILEAAAKTVWLGGNIGVPPLDFLAQVKPEHWVVLELSSFQLLDVTQSPHIGVLLAIVPEHADWHTDQEEYAQAKGNLVRFQKPGDLVVYNAQNEVATRLARLSSGRQLPYLAQPGACVADGYIWMNDTKIMATAEVALPGPHNLENVCAAVAATWDIVKSAAPIRVAVKDFTGLPYRLELVRELEGVKYYNDSFGTTPETAIAAIRAFDQPKILILGGSDKGSNYQELTQVITAAQMRRVILIGQMGPEIGQKLVAAGFSNIEVGGETMTAIVEQARAAAQSGDVVLLSPACASFGMFKDYKDRGNQFSAAVKALKPS